MKNYLILFALLFFSASGLTAENLSMNDLIGSWSATERTADIEPVISMNVTESGEITVTNTTHVAGHELLMHCKSNIERVQLLDDLFVIPCENTKTAHYKLVIGGSKTGGSKQLFGMFYYYSKGRIWKGLKVEIEQHVETDNKSLNSDASDARAS